MADRSAGQRAHLRNLKREAMRRVARARRLLKGRREFLPSAVLKRLSDGTLPPTREAYNQRLTVLLKCR
jgi:hypothetical protein